VIGVEVRGEGVTSLGDSVPSCDGFGLGGVEVTALICVGVTGVGVTVV